MPVDAHWFPTGQIVDSGIILDVAYGPGPSRAEVWNPDLNLVTRMLPFGSAVHGSRSIDEVVVVGVESGATRVLHGADLGTNTSDSAPDVAWSSSGWLFAAGVGGTQILAWQPESHGAFALPSARLPVVRLDPPEFQLEHPSMVAV